MKEWIKLSVWMTRHLRLRERRMIVVTVLCVIIASGCMAMSPLLLGRLTDGLLQARSGSGWYIVFLVFGYLATIALPRIIGVLVLQLQSTLRLNANSSLLAGYFDYLCEQSDSFFSKRNSGELSQEIAQASNDLYIIIRSFSSSAVAPLVQIGIAIAVLAANRNVIMAGLIAVYVVLFMVNHRVQGRKLGALKTGSMVAGRRTYTTLVDSIANIQVARQFNGYDFLLARYRKALDEDRDAQAAYWNVSAQMQLVNALLFVGLFGASFMFALYDVVQEGRSVGNLVLVGTYALTLLSPIETLGNMFAEINRSLATFGQFIEKLSRAPASVLRPASATVSAPGCPAIEFEQVSLTYPGAQIAVLKEVSFTVSPGQRIVITGPSGAGKSSIVKALTKQYPPDHGSIRLFGQDIATFDVRTLNERVGCVSQDVFLFKDTLRFNLLIARPSASDQELLSALDRAGLDDFLSNLPHGLDTLLGDRGATISGGQRQRLALARLFLRVPDIVVIDEGMSSLDVVTERWVIDQILESFAGATILMVTHRPSAMAIGDAVIVVHDGRIEGYGTYDDLRSRSDFFARVTSEATC
ncbi:ATP-binding cassette domain-containing protein [Bradyrhizobium ontarionense]|uniref:ATP-binding cassette domain-containing protein n=1 Tax=Bradyrhizobium ontarionense TaxID=2898149 RepID=A0ABY3R7F1_9BRAD|nr:ATP-binding cassette domain-containing protein [Bradyrhizobium sp. A19]UFZ02688.1 ATP-binding cassette domain-containing protein [Bradyrhizobium sp. A19]